LTIEANFPWAQPFHHLHRLPTPLDQADTALVPTPSKMVSTKALQEHLPAESFLTQIITEALNAKETEIDDATAEALKVSELHVVIQHQDRSNKMSRQIRSSRTLSRTSLGKSHFLFPLDWRSRRRLWEALTSTSRGMNIQRGFWKKFVSLRLGVKTDG
jgi:hypothetical protein